MALIGELHRNREVRVALCQIEAVARDRNANMQRIANALEEARVQNADLAVFPESCLLGWINPTAHQLATPIPGKDSAALCKLVRDAGSAMIIGLDEKDGNDLYGAAIAISSGGDIIAKHRKRNILPSLMEPPYSVGESLATIADFEFARVAMLICADSFEDSALEAVHAAKPDILVVPYGWVAEPNNWPIHGEKLRALVGDIALKLGLPVVGVDCVGEVAYGPWKGRKYCGASTACDANGKVLTTATFGEPSVTTITLNLGKR